MFFFKFDYHILQFLTTMRLKFYHIIIIFLPLFSNGQHSLDYGNDGNAWLLCSSMQGSSFSSSNESIAVLDEILNTVGASRRFQLQACTNINNAVAITLQGVRYIMYDPEWIASLDYTQDWAGKFILAHEVGHHINGHTIDVMVLMNNNSVVPLYKKRIQELEADKFAGFVMANLGASLNEALIAVNRISDDSDDSNSTHPSRSKRIEAVTAGYNQGKGFKSNSNSTAESPYSNTNYSGVRQTKYSSDDYVYYGTTITGTTTKSGYGTLKFNSGHIYEGEFVGNQFNGFGKYIFPSGVVMEGEWVNNVFVSGIVSQDGRDGSWFKRGNFAGSPEGGYYMDGWAAWYYEINGFYVEGIWSNEAIEQGLLITDDLDTFAIGFKSGQHTGFLEFQMAGLNSDLYEGDFTEDNLIAKTSFKNARMEYSKYIIERQDRMKSKCYNVLKYIPEFIERDLNIPTASYGRTYDNCVGYAASREIGYVELYLNEVRFYTGYGRQNNGINISTAGFGILDYSQIARAKGKDTKYYDRKKYVGMFWNNRFNGEGVLYYEDGTLEQGVWHNGELVEEKKVDLNQMMKDLKDF